MNFSFDDLIGHYRKKGVLVDANLLLLYVIGLTDESLIERFKRTSMYNPDHFHFLIEILNQFQVRYVTPNIMTEVSNLAGKLSGKEKELAFCCIRKTFHNLEEQYIPTRSVMNELEFLLFGLTDTTIISLLKTDVLLLTVDGPLAGHCNSIGLKAINFTILSESLFR